MNSITARWNILDSIQYAQQFSEIPTEDEKYFEYFLEALDEYNVKPMSLNSVGIFNLGANLTTAMAMRGVLHPNGLIDHLEHTHPDILYMAYCLGPKKMYPDPDGIRPDFHTLSPFWEYDSLIHELGGRHYGYNLSRARKSIRLRAGNMLYKPDYRYEAVCAPFVAEALSPDKKVGIRAWNNIPLYVERGGFFLTSVMLETDEFVNSDGTRISMGNFTETEVRKVFDQMPVKYRMWVSTFGDIRPGYGGTALVAGRTK